MPVAGIDPGTLEDRFTGMPWRGSVIAKTGTLVRTDGGASSLVGQMRAANGEMLLFVIMNQRGSVWRFRENQDYLVMLVQNSSRWPEGVRLQTINADHATLSHRKHRRERRVRATLTIQLSRKEMRPGIRR